MQRLVENVPRLHRSETTRGQDDDHAATRRGTGGCGRWGRWLLGCAWLLVAAVAGALVLASARLATHVRGAIGGWLLATLAAWFVAGAAIWLHTACVTRGRRSGLGAGGGAGRGRVAAEGLCDLPGAGAGDLWPLPEGEHLRVIQPHDEVTVCIEEAVRMEERLVLGRHPPLAFALASATLPASVGPVAVISSAGPTIILVEVGGTAGRLPLDQVVEGHVELFLRR
mmetsp:Transcript_108841/g.306722  ORF Transcript_108841/g.306722 Transcript_108841/m.306722 type:complete len:226 (-) Transcript_108841:107-784(-)